MRRAPHPLVPALLLAALLSGCSGVISDIKIGSTGSLWLLWLVPALLVFYIYAFRTRSRLLQRFASSAMLERLTAGLSRPRQYFKAALVLVAVLACVVALAEPKYGFTWEEVEREGVDIVVALDVSDSMLVEDAESGGKLSRLERAKREITDLLRLLQGDRIGLVAFAGTAFLECPLTLDYGAAEVFLGAIDTDLIPLKGTAVGEAIRTSLEAFEGAEHDSRAIILITDGEDHGGDALRTAEAAKEAGVRIFTIGIGRDEGAPIPAPGGGFRRDRQGEMILSRLDETTLKRIALETGGRYVRSVTGDVDLEQIYIQGIKATMEDQELGSRRRQRWEERFQWVLALAILALMLEPVISERMRRKGALLLCLLLMAPGAQAQTAQQPSQDSTPVPAPESAAQKASPKDPIGAYEAGAYPQALQGFVDRQVERPEDPKLLLNVGSTQYKMKNYDEAEKNFFEAARAKDPSIRNQAYYSLGNTAYRQGKLQEAVDHYKAALEADPDDQDAKYNLEFVREEIRRRLEEQKKRQEQQQQQQQDQQDQQQQDQQDQQQQDQQQQDQGQQGQQDQQQDQDGDGLPDSTEQSGENPTDPQNPDSDGDGVADGQEDANRNGRVDEGETDPNNPDTDGDGTGDAQEEQHQQPQQQQAQAGQAREGEPEEGLTPEEALRYLQGLEEGRPDPQRKLPPGRRGRPAKDW